MRRMIGTTALALAGVMALAAAANADSIETTNGVTTIHGKSATPPAAAAPAPAEVARSGTTAPPVAAGRSGGLNAVHTGSENAGGIIANPPPGAGG